MLVSVIALSASVFAFADEPQFKPLFFTQFQYRDSNEISSNQFRGQHGFAVKRARPGFQYIANEFLSAKVVLELVGGPNLDIAKLKEASVTFKPETGGMSQSWTVGQFSIPYGVEVPRSASESEMPERTGFSRTQFAGESFLGVAGTFTQGAVKFTIGGFNAMGVDDAETQNLTPSPGGRMAVLGGVRYQSHGLNVGLTHFSGERPAFTNGSNTGPAADRSLTAVDFLYQWDNGFSIRSEYSFGRDRIPLRTTSDRPMNAGFLQLAYATDSGAFFTRYATWDPDANLAGDLRTEFGLGYRVNMGSGLTATLAWEKLDDETKPRAWNVVTFRVQFKF